MIWMNRSSLVNLTRIVCCTGQIHKQVLTTLVFFWKIFEDLSPFRGPTDIPVLDFWWHLLWISKSEGAALFMLDRGIHVTRSLRFTSGATPANLLVASMAAEPFFSTYLQAGFGGAQNWNLSCHCCLTVWDQADSLPTKLYTICYFIFFVFSSKI